MDVVTVAKLSCIVVTPTEHVVSLVNRCDEAAAHSQLLHWVAELRLHDWAVLARLEQWREGLQHFHKSGQHFVVLQESICRARAEWPAPVEDLVALINESNVLRVVSDQLLDVH